MERLVSDSSLSSDLDDEDQTIYHGW